MPCTPVGGQSPKYGEVKYDKKCLIRIMLMRGIKGKYVLDKKIKKSDLENIFLITIARKTIITDISYCSLASVNHQ